MTERGAPYLAFVSGSLTYDCRPCGRCCRGLGIADDPDHLRASPELQKLAPFVADVTTKLPLVTIYTYGDGCRYLANDNLCSLHRDAGPDAKPLICRLFPFSKLVDLDGLWVVLPHHLCPWTAAGDEPSELSDHAAVLATLDDGLLGRLTPLVMVPRTPLAVERRRRLEESIREGSTLDVAPLDAIAEMDRRQADGHGPTVQPPEDAELWLDMLRCAGEPQALPVPMARLFVAALPAMRIHLAPRMPLEAIPTALRSFELCIRSLAELHLGVLSGEDLLLLLDRRVPLLTLMAYAGQPLPDVGDVDAGPWDLQPIMAKLEKRRGEALGEAVLAVLRGYEQGALTVMMQLGEILAPALGPTEMH
ncbi:MAG: YkgJ family cysteine cluster protein [Myxococcota bacterium]